MVRPAKPPEFPAARPREPATVERLRHEIDSGQTGDKVPASDPAAAPLGADDEAAGRPPDGAAVESARQQAPPDIAGDGGRRLDDRVWWILIAVAAICVAGIVAAVLMGR